MQVSDWLWCIILIVDLIGLKDTYILVKHTCDVSCCTIGNYIRRLSSWGIWSTDLTVVVTIRSLALSFVGYFLLSMPWVNFLSPFPSAIDQMEHFWPHVLENQKLTVIFPGSPGVSPFYSQLDTGWNFWNCQNKPLFIKLWLSGALSQKHKTT